MTSRAAFVALSLALLLPSGVEGQRIAPDVEAGAQVTTRDGELPVSAMRFAPGLNYASERIAISARGSALLVGERWTVGEGAVSTVVTSPTYGGVHGEFTGRASRAFFADAMVDDNVDARARLHYVVGDQRAGVWVTGGVTRPWHIAAVPTVDVAGGGAWTRFGGATLGGSYTNFFFARVIADSASAAACGTQVECRRYSHFSDLEASVRWDLGLLELAAQSGLRFGEPDAVTPDSRRWAAGSATLWLSNRIAAVFGGGRIPANPARGMPARSYANFGVMLAYAPIARRPIPVAPRTTMVRSFETRLVTPGIQRMIVRIGGVESVDVMGDFSDWQPLTLVRRGRDLWEISVPMDPGVHQLNVRVDGGPWTVPPGLPSARDGFGGEIALLVIQ